MKTWDPIETRYILNHSGRIDENDIAHFPRYSVPRLYLGDSFRYPGLKTLIMPSLKGTALYFEKMHFVID